VSALLRLCDVRNVPLATNLASDHIVVEWIRYQLTKASPSLPEDDADLGQIPIPMPLYEKGNQS
jgi:methylglyoxal synthase